MQIWVDAVGQWMFNSGLAQNTLIKLGNHKKDGEPLLLSTIWIPLMNFGTSIYAAITLFAFVGYVSKQTGVPIEDLPMEGMELTFVVYPNLLATLPFPHVWSTMFYLMLTFVGFSSEYLYFDAISGLIQGFLKRKYNLQLSQTFIIAILWIITLFMNLVFFASSAGYCWLETFDHYASGINLIIFLFIQIIVFVYILPLSDMEEKINKYGEKFPKLYDFSLKYICPILALFLAGTTIVNEFMVEHKYNNIFEFILKWTIFFTPSVIFVLFFFYDPYKKTENFDELNEFAQLDNLIEEPSSQDKI